MMNASTLRITATGNRTDNRPRGWSAHPLPERTLWVTTVGVACCAVETGAAYVSGVLAALDVDMGPGQNGAGVRPADIVVIAGTVTDRSAPRVRAEYTDLAARLETRPLVISFGSCANTGGPYWDSYSVTKGIDQVIDVDRYVPGCPPRPQALAAAIDDLRRRPDAGAA